MKTKPSILAVLALSSPALAGVIYVDVAATGVNDGSSWTNGYTSLSSAIAAASSLDEIRVKQGVYGPVSLKSGVRIYGGFDGTETRAADSNPAAHRTVINAGGARQAVRSIGNDRRTILRGFVITGGAAKDDEAGGGVYLENSNAVFTDCVFRNNSAEFAGGAVANYFGGSPTFANCRFVDNGGGSGRPTPVGGGAVYNHDGSPTFINCLFHGNKAGDGGAVVSLDGAINIVNCTFTNNEATQRHAGALFDNMGRAVVRNCILWNNRAALAGAGEIYNHPRDGVPTSVAFSDVKGGWPGEGNADADPLFVDPVGGDYRLQSASPLGAAGNRNALPPDVADLDWDGDTTEPVSRDLDLLLRSDPTIVEMGALRRIGS